MICHEPEVEFGDHFVILPVTRAFTFHTVNKPMKPELLEASVQACGRVCGRNESCANCRMVKLDAERATDRRDRPLDSQRAPRQSPVFLITVLGIAIQVFKLDRICGTFHSLNTR
jgi:hypothetical protein